MNIFEIRYKFRVPADISKTWKTWTTKEGIDSFFCRNNSLEFRPGGRFELYFDSSAEPGLKGSEDMTIMAIEHESMLSFTWNAPPSIPDIRGQITAVQIYFTSAGNSETEILFINSGYGKGESWQKTREYFIRAWGDIVLPKFRCVMENGPIDLENPPDCSVFSCNR